MQTNDKTFNERVVKMIETCDGVVVPAAVPQRRPKDLRPQGQERFLRRPATLDTEQPVRPLYTIR